VVLESSLNTHGRRIDAEDTAVLNSGSFLKPDGRRSRSHWTVTFNGGQIVSDAGLLPIRELDKKLGILAEAARRMPDPRTENSVTHTAEDILTQQVYQILAGYPDGNDAQLLRHDPLFNTIVANDPRREEKSLASGSMINRFLHAFTRREVQQPIAEREVIFEVRRAQVQRINALNDFLIDLFVRTRKNCNQLALSLILIPRPIRLTASSS